MCVHLDWAWLYVRAHVEYTAPSALTLNPKNPNLRCICRPTPLLSGLLPSLLLLLLMLAAGSLAAVVGAAVGARVREQ